MKTAARLLIPALVLACAATAWAQQPRPDCKNSNRPECFPKVDCSDPAYKYLPSCDGHAEPGFPDSQKRLRLDDVRNCARIKRTCAQKHPPRGMNCAELLDMCS